MKEKKHKCVRCGEIKSEKKMGRYYEIYKPKRYSWRCDDMCPKKDEK